MDEDDAENVKEILTVVSEKVPALLNSLADVLYGKEQSAKYGQAVAGFFKTLKDSGMSEEQAYELTKQYMSAMNLAGMIGKAIGERRGEGKRGLSVKLGKGEHGHHESEEEEEEA